MTDKPKTGADALAQIKAKCAAITDELEIIALRTSSKIFQLRHPVCPDCKSRVKNLTNELYGCPDYPSVDVFWKCHCCEESTADPKWAGIWWPFNTVIPHLRWRVNTAWRQFRDYQEARERKVDE